MTLVEIMASAAILGIAISGTATLLRAGQDLEYRKDLERQAYGIAYSALEHPNYHYYPNYDSLPGNTSSTQNMNTSGRALTANIQVTVHPEQKENWISDSTCWKRVDARVIWSYAGTPDTVTVSKLLAKVK